MGNVTAAIQKYINENIRLSQSDISQSAKSREWLLARIKTVIANRTKEPVLYEKPFIYFGSYFKGTKVQVVDEYDVLVVIDSNNGQFTTKEGKIGVGLGTAHPNHKYHRSRYYKSDDSGVSPAKLLNWLKGVIEEAVSPYDGEAPERHGQAITATIKSKNLKIDLVPAGIFKHINTGMIFYDIPNGRQDNGWILTAPQQDIDDLNVVATGKTNFKNVIRILKRIKDTYNFLVPSFAIERAVVDYSGQIAWRNDLYLDIYGALIYLSLRFRDGKITDPFDSNNNLLADIENVGWYADRLDKIAKVLVECSAVNDQETVYRKICDAFENSVSSIASRILGIGSQKAAIIKALMENR